FSMRMNHDTVLEAAARAGIELPFSCRAGVCSTCRTKVVRGAVEMAQNYALEDWELGDGYVLACQSRVKTPSLELDYDEKSAWRGEKRDLPEHSVRDGRR